MKAEIEQRLQPLIGEPLSDMWRYAGYQRFEFGIQRPSTNRKGQAITISDWALVVGGDWRITGVKGVIVSSSDFGETERNDGAAHEFYTSLSDTFAVVETIMADDDGSLRIALTQGYILEVFVTRTHDGEFWRFMPKEEYGDQLVMRPQGLSE